MEYIYDVENYQLLGEINQYSQMGRWSVGYFFDAASQKWAVCQTDATTRAMVFHYDDKESALEKYKTVSDELVEIAKRIREKRIPGSYVSEDMKRKDYLDCLREINREKSEKRKTELKPRADYYKEVNEKKKNSFVDYVKYYTSRTGAAPNREDYVWICSDGDVIFEGKVAHQYDAYLIGANINTIKPYFETIKGLIIDYCRKSEGHHIYDPSRNNRDIEYYGRREDGFIQKRISNIESFKYDDLVRLFNDAIENKEFPNGRALIDIKKSISAYLDYMNKHR